MNRNNEETYAFAVNATQIEGKHTHTHTHTSWKTTARMKSETEINQKLKQRASGAVFYSRMCVSVDETKNHSANNEQQ